MNPAVAAGVPAGGWRKQGTLSGNADHVRGCEQHDRQQQVGDRPRCDDGDAPPNALPVECTREVRWGHVSLALVDHLDVPTERNRRKRPFGAVGTDAPRPDDAAETHRETQYLDACEPCDKVVAEFVKHDEHAKRHREGEHLLHHVDHAKCLCA